MMSRQFEKVYSLLSEPPDALIDFEVTTGTPQYKEGLRDGIVFFQEVVKRTILDRKVCKLCQVVH
jgi:hypothetical protein